MQELKNKLAQGVETLIYRLQKQDQPSVFDVVIIGSGYGGAVAAARLAAARSQAGKPLRICVLERGREFLPGDFPRDFSRLPAEVRFEPAKTGKLLGFANGLFDFHFNDDVSVLRGNGLGGGSLINASVVERMSDLTWQAPQWPQSLRVNWRQFTKYYQRVEQMLAAQVLPRAQWPQKTFALEKLGTAIDAAQRRKQGADKALTPSFRPVKLASQLFAAGETPWCRDLHWCDGTLSRTNQVAPARRDRTNIGAGNLASPFCLDRCYQ
ncbi:MAG: GMC family oxidoreductase N-terminal domain-containing protein [Burkholderiales bacterium]|nr:GMC family oxidoreductase N-terminal domain-containing protein [Burkholderiales bacterium]